MLLPTSSALQLTQTTQPTNPDWRTTLGCKTLLVLITCSLSVGLAGCSDGSNSNSAANPEATAATADAPQTTVEDQLRLALETAKPGDVIQIPAGTHKMKRGLVLNTDGVTLRGEGMDKSILSFKNQIEGAEGLLVNASDFTIEDVGLEDTPGDALKINEGSNIVVRRVRTEWTGGPSVSNGAYGIYPVQTENVLVEHSVAIAASDAGIYVGQSRNIVVRHNRAEYNVAGIEIENSVHADVYDNIAINNTGGILVFNMPAIPMSGHSTRVFDNDVRSNNTDNFAVAGSAVSGVPSGSGVVINSNDKVEIFNNRLTENNTANILISSYYTANFAGQQELAKEFDPYPEKIYIYGNYFTGGGGVPDRAELMALLETEPFATRQRLPDVVWDGYVRDGGNPATANICISSPNITMLNMDFANNGANLTTDMQAHRCTQAKLEPVALATP